MVCMCFFNPFAEIDFDSFPTKEAMQQQCKHFYPVFLSAAILNIPVLI